MLAVRHLRRRSLLEPLGPDCRASFQVNLRPVLVTSRLEDPVQKIRWVDDHWAQVAGARRSVELVDGNIYLAISLRNVGPGLAVTYRLVGARDRVTDRVADVAHAAPEDFRMQTRDLYIAAGDVGFWQAAIRESRRSGLPGPAQRDVETAEPFTIELLYGDHEGGQRTITRFGMIPVQVGDETKWYPVRRAALELGSAGSPLGTPGWARRIRGGDPAAKPHRGGRTRRRGPRRNRSREARGRPSRGCWPRSSGRSRWGSPGR